MRLFLVTISIAACHHDPAPTPAPAPAPTGPRCVLAGGTCVGPAAIAANPAAPCSAGMHRVDNVAIAGDSPACFGIPMGEEACCMPDVAR